MLPWLNPESLAFPDIETALEDPNGLLAAGGDLGSNRLVSAYRQGIFPWFTEEQPILWWSPNPRCVIKPEDVHISRSLRKHIRKYKLSLSFDTAFERVIEYCSREESEEGTWITYEMQEAYIELYRQGVAHSLEVWQEDNLIGGLYGLSQGRVFFGESMFSRHTNASKVAFVALCQQLSRWQYALIDCQVENNHLLSLGAQSIPRTDFLSLLSANIDQQANHHAWEFDRDILESI